MNHHGMRTARPIGIVLAALAISIAAPVGAFEGPEHADRMLEHLTAELGLTADQQERLRPILDEKVETLRELREQQRAVRDSFASRISAELSPEQVEQFSEMQQEMHQRREQRHGRYGRHGGRHGRVSQ